MNTSYDSSALIEKAKKDIALHGDNFPVFAVFSKIEGKQFLTRYVAADADALSGYIADEAYLTTLGDVLRICEKQNSLFNASAFLDYETFMKLILSVPDSEDLEHFITDRGYEPWMEAYIDEDRNGDTVADILSVIWHTAHGGIAEMLKHVGMKQTELSALFHIPLRTVQNWVSTAPNASHTAPDYVTYLILYAYIMQTYPPLC